MKLSHWLACLLALASGFPARSGAASRSSAAELRDGSLEAYLEKLRREREAEFARLHGKVEELVKRLGATRGPSDAKKLQGELDALGSEVPPLLLAYLDPGPDAPLDRQKSAEEVAQALQRSRHPALFEPLCALAHTASPAGRVLAVRVLGSPAEEESARALAALRELYAATQVDAGELRAECVRSLARLAPTDPLVAGAIQDSDTHVVRAALDALTRVPHTEALPAVLELVKDASRAAPVLVELVAYFSVPGLQLEEDAVVALLRLAARGELTPEARIALLDGLPRFGGALGGSKLRKEIEPLLNSSDTAVHEAALVALTLLKDSKAKRELLKFYDDLVENNPRWPQAYQKRGDVELRIGEYGKAAEDYQKAIELHADSARLPGNRELWINRARALVKDNKLKAAADTLEGYGLNSELKRAVKEDPDFTPLVEHPKYKKLFE